MNKAALTTLLALMAWLCPLLLFAQNTSNKGTDFWIGYMGHIDGTGSAMKLYITSDVSTTGTVSVPGQSWSQSFTVTANSVTVINIPPTTAYIGCGDCVDNRAIRVVSAQPVVVYSHIHANARSDATLVLPTSTLGREYFCMSFTQMVTGSNRANQFMVIGVEDSTTVQITPAATSLNGNRQAGQTFTISLNKGEAYQLQSNSDITGSLIQSVAGNSGSCKRIAVFSGSSFTPLGCSSASSGDNLYQQMYPLSTWGKEFITAPMKTRTGGDYFRILAGTDNTDIYLNNAYIKTLQRGQYHEFISSTANYIRATLPVMMAQFQRTQNCDNVTGDPSMTILSPIEQSLNDITLYSSPYQNITNHHINIVMKAKDTGSFRLDGNAVQWSYVSSKPTYMYSQTTVSSGNHILNADSGFLAMAYGFGNVESYGYAAGAGIKNLSHYISTAQGSVCRGVPTKFIANTTYTPASYRWYLQDTLFSTAASPVITFDTLGSFNMALVTIKSNQNDCESKDSSGLTISIYNQPKAKFTVPFACKNDTLKLRDSSTIAAGPSYINKWRWEFGDGTFNTNQNANKKYDSAYNFKIKLIVGTNHGCFDTLVKPAPVQPIPKPKFGFKNVCYKDSAYFTDSSTIDSTSIAAYTWDFGDGKFSSLKSPSHYFSYADSFYVKLKVLSNMGCTDSLYDTIVIYPKPVAQIITKNICHRDTLLLTDNTITGTDYVTARLWNVGPFTIDTNKYQKWYPVDTGLRKVRLWVKNNYQCEDTVSTWVDVYSKPRAVFGVANKCFTDTVVFKDSSKIDEGTITYHWDFADGGISVQKNPKWKYNVPGAYLPSLVLTSDKGCRDSATRMVSAVDTPSINFDLKDVCVYDSAVLLDKTTYSFGTTTLRQWDLGDGATSTAASPVHKYAMFGNYTLSLKIGVSQLCFDTLVKTLTIYPKPRSHFYFTDDCLKIPVKMYDSTTVNMGNVIRHTWDVDGKPDTGLMVSRIWYSEGQKPVTLVTESDFGCVDTATRYVTIYPAPKPNFSAPEVCLDDTMRFTDASTITQGKINFYLWDFADGHSGASGNTTWHVYDNWGNYNVGLTAISDKDCIDSIRKQVRINPLPVALFYTNDTAGCEPLLINFTDTSTVAEGIITRRLWQFGDNRSDTAKHTLHTYTKNGVYSPKLTVITDKGCKKDSVYAGYLTAYKLPVAAFRPVPDSISFFTPAIQFKNTSTPDVILWDWDLGDGEISADESPEHEYADTGRYTIRLIVANNNTCLDTAYGKVFISPDFTFFIPTAFTPGAGDLNPDFGPDGVFKGIIEYNLKIYTRWGELVFETNDLFHRWNGVYKNTPAETGVYFYQITIMDYFKKKTHYKGSVLLIR